MGSEDKNKEVTTENENLEDSKEKKHLDEETKKKITNDLKRVMNELKKQEEKKQNAKKKKPRVLAIEFGGVYHTNVVVNFLFGYLLNLTLAFLIIELTHYAVYSSIYVFLGVMLVFSMIEYVFRNYIFMQHFKLIIQSFGTIFFFGYVLIFYLVDQFIFIQSFNFINGLVEVFFVLLFAVLRYGFGLLIRRFIRHGWK